MKRKFAVRASIFVAFLALAGFAAPDGATAQTAKNLKCNGCIKSKQIKDGKVKAKDLHNGAKPGQAAYSAQGGFYATSATVPTAVREVTLNLPGPGAVIATGSVTMSSATNGILCKVDTSVTAINTGTEVFGALSIATGYGSVFTQRVFTAAAGPFTVYLVCYSSGAGGNAIYAPSLSLLFVPGAQTISQESADAKAKSASATKFGQ